MIWRENPPWKTTRRFQRADSASDEIRLLEARGDYGGRYDEAIDELNDAIFVRDSAGRARFLTPSGRQAAWPKALSLWRAHASKRTETGLDRSKFGHAAELTLIRDDAGTLIGASDKEGRPVYTAAPPVLEGSAGGGAGGLLSGGMRSPLAFAALGIGIGLVVRALRKRKRGS